VAFFIFEEERKMSSLFPNGTIFSISTAYAAAVAVSAYSNAKPTVATISGGVIEDGSIMIVKSEWAALNERIARAANVTPDSVEMEGFDTTDEDIFVPGGSEGSLVVVTAWQQLAQTTEISTSGGEQQFYQWQYLEDRNSRQRQRPTYKNAKAINATYDYDAEAAWYQALVAADQRKEPVVLRGVLPNKVQLLYYVYPSIDGDPSLVLNENMKVRATYSLIGEVTRY